MRFNQGIIDAHVHVHGGCGVDNFLRNVKDHLSASGLDGINLLCVKIAPNHCITEPEALLAKSVMDGRVTALGNPAFFIPGYDGSPEGVGQQVQDFLDGGLDGVKLGGGNARRDLDDPIFDPMFSVLEKNDAPIVFHVGGFPYEPARRKFKQNHFASFRGQVLYPAGSDDDVPESYKESTAELNERCYGQINRILARHKDLKLILAHTYMRADDLDLLSTFLDDHPNVCVDVTPCEQIYYYWSRNRERAREFIGDYRKRILFGTDNAVEADPLTKIILQRTFFETDEEFFAASWGFDLHGIALPKEILEDLYKNNYLRLFRREPVDPKRAVAFCEKTYETLLADEELPGENREELLECARRFRERI